MSDPLHSSRDQLLDETKQGKWWKHAETKLDKVAHSSTISNDEVDAKVLHMAKKCKMNTDVRKAIFSVIMTSEDYMDAVERMAKLALKGKQNHEVPRVVIACLTQERVYNPYYACIAQKMCKDSRASTFTFQLCLWDAVKVLEDSPVRHVAHMARFYSHLVGLGCVPMSCLKVLSWEALPPKQLAFATLCLGAILTTFSEEQVVKLFRRVQGSKELQVLTHGLQVFVKEHVQKHVAKVAGMCGVEEDLMLTRGKMVSRVLNSSRSSEPDMDMDGMFD